MTLNALTPLNGGAIFADFRIVCGLGSGGMGEVLVRYSGSADGSAG